MVGSVVSYHPLLLPAAGLFGGRDLPLDGMYRPAEARNVFTDSIVREHRQHELARHLRENSQQLFQVLLVEGIRVVTAVGAHIGRIDEVERLRTIVTADDVFAVLALHGDVRKALTDRFRELILAVEELERRRAAAVVAERTVKHRGEA